MREFERFNTVCANAYVQPLMATYLGELERRLQATGARCPVSLIHSGGGLMTVETASRFPVRLVESGPAGGAIFAADIAARHGLDAVLSYDMGGTTAKICLIEDQTPRTAKTFEVARTHRFNKGSGMPIAIPVIEMIEIGAGGGSIAHLDAGEAFRVGPQSAGAEPGPAAYNRGGTLPTVTDANVVLGRLQPGNFLGAQKNLNASAAREAVSELAEKLGMSIEAAADGILTIINANMANAIRSRTVQKGHDPREFSLVAFGGAGPLHGVDVARDLGIPEVIIPPCLLYTSPSPRDRGCSRMPSSA